VGLANFLPFLSMKNWRFDQYVQELILFSYFMLDRWENSAASFPERQEKWAFNQKVVFCASPHPTISFLMRKICTKKKGKHSVVWDNELF